MIEFHGKPFLEYLVDLLGAQGFRRLLLLLGYRANDIQSYFGDGSRWNLDIEYSVSAESAETGARLEMARAHLDPIFLLMYCDNYWPLAFDPLWQHFTQRKVKTTITVYSNKDAYSKDNVQVDEHGYVTRYDKSRTAPGLGGVEIGYAIVDRSVLDLMPKGNPSFESTVYPKLVGARQLGAFITSHRYYSVGSHERLPLTEKFLSAKRTVFVDRDGVLNKKAPRAQYVRNWNEFNWLEGAREALCLLHKAEYRVIVVSNQAGIARGAMTQSDLEEIHQSMQADVIAAGGKIEAIYFCPHDWDEGCDCRKPSPGMLFQAQRDFHLDLSRTYFVGDDERDMQAAEAAGCPGLLVSDDTSFLDIAHQLINSGDEHWGHAS